VKLRNHQDFWSGVMFVVLGVLFIALSRQYQMGSAAKMGPGYFPTVLGGILALLGAMVMVGAFAKSNSETKLAKVGWRELFLVLLGVGLFAVLLPKLGMVVSLWILIFVSALASHEFNFKETFVSAIALSILAWGVFAKGLELQMAVWPKFLTQ
jgi:putative Mn2+ efflux pump MntP